MACSGGPDSLALLGILHALSRQLGLVLHVAHFDHRMRVTSVRDARLVQRVAASLDLPFRLGSASRAPRSEAEARDARYRFLRAVARENGARVIALGHTQDDQAETVLLHLVRGSGIAGLAAMRPRRDDLARPLLGLSRAETETYARTMGVRPARDPTNRDVRHARNLVRLRVVPLLERINPRSREALARLADNAAALADLVRSRAEDALRGALLNAEGREKEAGRPGEALPPARPSVEGGRPSLDVVLDLDRLPASEAIRSEVLALAAERVGAALSERHRRALVDLSREREGSARLDLPRGVVALREYTRLRLGARAEVAPPPEPVRLEPGRAVRWGEWTFLADAEVQRPPSQQMGGPGEGLRPAGPPPSRDRLPLRARVPAMEPLLVRAWRSGDRLAGGKKVQDVLTDAKVPRRLRLAYPVVLSADGTIVWVPGLAAARAPEGADTGLHLLAEGPAAAWHDF